MNLSKDQLTAFEHIARLGTFTRAAKSLSLTQSALSHRIRQLEAQIETTVFVRTGNRARLTEVGEKLLRFCQVQSQLEDEWLTDIKAPARGSALIKGRIRIAGVSTLMRPVILPALAGICQKHSDIRFEFFVKEIRELPKLLLSGEVDMLVTTEKLNLGWVNEQHLGHELNVLIEPSHNEKTPDVYLDHDPEDRTTFDFFKGQGIKNPTFQRSYLDDIYGIIDAVELGMGKAVVPMHLAERSKKIKVVQEFKPLRYPIYLYDFHQPYYTKLHQLAASTVQQSVKNKLG